MNKPRPNLAEVFESGQMEAAGAVPPSPPNRRAFISAPLSVDTSVIRQVLESRGIAPYEIDEVATAGVSIPQLLADCLKQADLVVAVLGGGKSNDNVLFELGFAMALGKRILALVPSDEQLPISEIPYLRARADNKEAIEFGIDQILDMPWAKLEAPRDQVRKTRPIGDLADRLLTLIRKNVGPLKEKDLEMIIRDVIGASGISSVSYSSEMMTPAGRADMAIWSEDFEPWVGNPVVIEIKSQLRGRDHVDDALAQLERILDSTHTECGLLIYQGDQPDFPKSVRHSRIFVLTIEQLLDSLRDTSLADLLRKLRNQRVHGRG